jgi:hypothetical protein
MTAKPCLACGRLIASSAEACGFCGAEQASVAAALAKETRCKTCKRPYAAKLAACPFCARDRAAGIAPTPFGPTASLRPPVFEDESSPDDDAEVRPVLGVVLSFAIPLVALALLGLWQSIGNTPLASDDAYGPLRPSLLLALLASPLAGFYFVVRRYRSWSAALDALGAAKAAGLGALVALVAYVPLTLALAGLLAFLNGAGVESREQTLPCKVGSIWHRLHDGADLGWQMSYFCEVRGEPVIGSFDRLPARPDFVEGGPVFVRASRGRLGYWIRLGEPTASPPRSP